MERAPTLLAFGVFLGGVVSCTANPAASSGAPPPPPPRVAFVPTAVSPAPGDDERPVPERVLAVHRKILSRSLKPGTAVRCIITVHDGRLSHDRFYVVALLGGGSLATWTESLGGPIEPFLAKLTPDEDARASEWLQELSRERGAGRDRFSPSATVVGVSVRLGEHVETSYHPSDQRPAPLEKLMQLAKERLESANEP